MRLDPTPLTRRRITILGSTGSIGRQALDIVRRYPDRFEVVGLSTGSDARSLALQSAEFEPEYVALERNEIIEGLTAEVLAGAGSASELAGAPADVVLNAIVGFAGLAATVSALKSGNRVALANKESLVAGGEWVMDLAIDNRIIPVDSEHSAIFQCLEGRREEEIREILLTASGGPFFSFEKARLVEAGPEEALKHPTWRMGPKITIDSATLANKGLELIEAHFLFDLPYERVEVLLQPTSIVHALVRFRDGALLAHLGVPDMRVPISYALTYPERAATPVPSLDLAGSALVFEEPDLETFPLLALAREAGERGGTYPCAFNAANEVAVAAFLEGALPFLGIAETVARVLEEVDGEPAGDVAQLVEADAAARRAARGVLV